VSGVESPVRHFVVVGAQRCGTTYLHDLLEEHPEIAMARPARPEPKVFLRDIGLTATAYRDRFFAHADGEPVYGEKSTSYLESAAAPRLIAEVLGEPQILVQLRDPLARAVSHWRFSTQHGLEERPLADALAANLEGPLPWDPAKTSVSPYAYLERGRFADDLPRWLDAFDTRVVFLEETAAGADAIQGVYAWLGVDAAVRPAALGQPVNVSEGEESTLSDRLVTDLREWYDEPDRRLSDLLGRDLPWRTP
jgi:hypothetical protein